MAKTKNLQYYEAVGRRKEAVARVRLYLATKTQTADIKDLKIKPGQIYVNQKLATEFFPAQSEKALYLMPLKLTNNEERFAISIIVKGGGKRGQLDAVVNGLSKALNKVDRATYRASLKKAGLLTRDSRKRERRKVGTGGKARRKKQSPKR